MCYIIQQIYSPLHPLHLQSHAHPMMKQKCRLCTVLLLAKIHITHSKPLTLLYT